MNRLFLSLNRSAVINQQNHVFFPPRIYAASAIYLFQIETSRELNPLLFRFTTIEISFSRLRLGINLRKLWILEIAKFFSFDYW